MLLDQLDKYKIIQPKLVGTNELSLGNIPDIIFTMNDFPRKKINNKDGYSHLFLKSERKNQKLYSLFSTVNGMFLWSQKLVLILKNQYKENHLDGVQFFPVTVKTKNNDILSENYYLINNLHVKKIIDYKKSEIEWITNKNVHLILDINKFVPLYEKGEKIPLVEVKELPGVYFIHDSVVAEIKKQKIKDIIILDPEDENSYGLF